jgi:hypothetical protein
LTPEEGKEAPVFDSGRLFELRSFAKGAKCCVLRFPTDAEWCAWGRKQRSIRRSLGRGKTQIDSLNSDEANFELFGKIRSDKDGVEYNAAEASAAITRLQRAQVQDIEREGDTYRISLIVIGAATTHVLRMPAQEEVDAHEKASVSVVSGSRAQEIRTFLDPAGPFYDSLLVSKQGYSSFVPIVHKAVILNEMLRFIAQETEEADVPET